MRDAYLMMHSDWHEAAWRELVHAVRTGESGFERAHGQSLFAWLETHPEAADLFSRAMASGRSYRDAGVPQAYDFSKVSSIVDVGGGYGSLLLGILREHPQLRGVLFDLPSVAAGAFTQIQSAGLQERCQVVEGDFFDSVPVGSDVYLLAHIIHDWSDEAAIRILSNCARAITSGGSVLLVENVLPEDNAQGRTRWLDLEMLVLTPGGRERTRSDFAALGERAGLELLGVRSTSGSRAVLEFVSKSRGGAQQ
jgi:SAM-dependent methyltransferase